MHSLSRPILAGVSKNPSKSKKLAKTQQEIVDVSIPSGLATEASDAATGVASRRVAGAGPLGIYTNKSPSPVNASSPGTGVREIVDSDTGEIIKVRRGRNNTLEVVKSPQEARARRYMRLAASRRIMGSKHRLNVCNRLPAKGATEIEVWSKVDSSCPGHFKGVMTCGSVWLCAVCAGKISERRRVELQTAIALWKAEGGDVSLVTSTFSHGRHDVLRDSLDKLSKARKRSREGREYENIKADFGIIGTVLAFEIMHGNQHGWHPHFHELVFHKSGIDREEFRKRLFSKWHRACVLSGLGEPSEKHGLDVRDASHASKYVSKWGLESEMTKGHIKDGKNGSRSPFQLLDSATDIDADSAQRLHAEMLFVDYAKAMKNKFQLRWSHGLKKRFGLVDFTDEELSAQVEENAVLIAEISLEDWGIVRKHNLQSAVLDMASYGAGAIASLLNIYRQVKHEEKA